jgi:signal transduction histidine kinase/ActR/RegA family two-component response regulator
VIPHLSERGLILAPLGRDADVAAQMLKEARIRSVICHSLADLVEGLTHGAGFAVVTEEALRTADLHPLADWIGAQPEWSDFPFILLTMRGGIERNPSAMRLLRTLGNVTFLERPFHPTTLVSLAQAAIRGRRRQYEARARLRALAQLNETLEARVDAAIAEHKVLADIVESTDALVQVVDLDYRILAVNCASANEFERLFGVRPKVGDLLLELLTHAPEHRAALEAVWSRAVSGEEFTEILQFGEPGRDRRFYEMKFNTLYDRAGRRIGAYQFVYDVTRRLEDQERLANTESALRQAQKMEAVGQLTGGVAHDFNNLLMAFSSGMHLLDLPMDADRRRRIVDGMRQAIERGTALTRQLLAFSRRRPLAPKTVDLKQHLLGMHEMLQRSLRGDVAVEMSFDGDLWPVDVDPGELELAIINICVNARDAMPGGGTIRISARNGGNLLTPVFEDSVTLSISDSGAGMAKEVVARVFEPFFTTKEVGRGSGLGLAQVYGFVTQSNGQVAIDSTVGRGTTVSLTFPRSEAEVTPVAVAGWEAAPVPRRGAQRAGTRGRVLLVEDDLTVAALTTEMLSSVGYSVLHAKSAPAALEAVAADRKMDIVFSDVMMPGGMSGVDLAREVRRKRPDLPVVLTTGYIEVARTAMSEGLEVLVKPYQLEALARILDAHVAARHAGRRAGPAR